MESSSQEGIVLRKTDVGESDRNLIILSPQLGKFSAKAKGARKSKSHLVGFSESLSHISFQLKTSSKQKFLTQVESLDQFRELRTDFDRLSFALAFAELLETVIPFEDGSEEIYEFACGAFKLLCIWENPQLAFFWCNVKLLILTGFKPNFEFCSVTGAKVTEKNAIFSPSQGGFLSRGHLESIDFKSNSWTEVSGEALIGLERLGKMTAPPLSMKNKRQVLDILLIVWMHLADKELPAVLALRTLSNNNE